MGYVMLRKMRPWLFCLLGLSQFVLAEVSGPSSSTTGSYTISWDPVPETPGRREVINYEIKETFSGSSSISHTGSTSKTFSNSVNGNYTYQVTAWLSNINPVTHDDVVSSKDLGSKTVTVKKPPTVSASFNPSTISEGGSATYSWSSTNATSCSATGISGVSAKSGSKNYTASSIMSSNTSVTAKLICSGTGGSVSLSKNLNINFINDTPSISSITDKSISEDSNTGNIAFIVGDEETSAGSLTVTGTSSNTSLVTTGNISFGGGGANRTVKVTPTANKSGSATISVKVSDGSKTRSESFKLTVNSVNDAPTISSIPNKTINEDGNTGNINFTVGDVESSAGTLTPSGVSSNGSLIPNGNISFGGSGANRTIKVTPITNKNGTSTITVTISDGNKSASKSFVVTVNSVNDTPVISSISNTTIGEGQTSVNLPFSISDIETSPSSLVLSANSNNTQLIPVSNINFGGSGANRTVKVSSKGGAAGTATITVSVSDGQKTATQNFSVEVIGTPLNITVPATDEDGSYQVSWGAVSGATYYKIREKFNGNGWGAYTSTGASKAWSASDNINGKYFYNIVACNSNGCGTPGASSQVIVDSSPGTSVIYIHTDLLGFSRSRVR